MFRLTINSRRLLRGFVIAMAIGRSPLGAESRTWTDRTGKHTTEAEFMSLIDGKVKLKIPDTGKIVTIALEKLSDADQAEATALQAAADADADQKPSKPATKKPAKATAKKATGSSGTTDASSPAAPAKPRVKPNNVVNSVRGAVYRVQTEVKLRQVAMALVNFSSAQGKFPLAARATRDGKPGLSWRVMILPMLEEEALYRQFHLDEPWDSPHNRPLAEQMPDIYLSPGCDLGPGYTNYLAVAGPHSIISSGARASRPENVPDGLSRTIALVEADDTYATLWTKPDDYAWDPQQQQDPLYGLGNIWAGQFLVAMADGSVRFLPSSTPAETISALFSADGGETIQLDP